MFEGKWEFHTKGFRHYILLCNFERGIKENCVCLAPERKVKVSGSVFIEELYKDPDCKEKILF